MFRSERGKERERERLVPEALTCVGETIQGSVSLQGQLWRSEHGNMSKDHALQGHQKAIARQNRQIETNSIEKLEDEEVSRAQKSLPFPPKLDAVSASHLFCSLEQYTRPYLFLFRFHVPGNACYSVLILGKSLCINGYTATAMPSSKMDLDPTASMSIVSRRSGQEQR